MKRSTRCMIFVVYYISQLLGLLSFSYNSKNAKVEEGLFTTVYSGIVSVLIFCILPLFFRLHWKTSSNNGPKLHINISRLMCMIYIVAALITVLLNWTKRLQFINTMRDFQLLRNNFLKKFQMSKEVKHYYEKSIRRKFYISLISNVISFFLSKDLLRGMFDVDSPLVIMALGLVAIILNIIMDHYYFALLNINALLAVVNEEMERILHTSSVLFERQRLKKIKAGYLVTTCCKLADQMDDLAMEHYNLQHIGERVHQLYGLHGACVMLILYMNNISVIYMIYMVIQHKELSEEYGKMLVMVILPVSLFFFYKDLNMFMTNMLHFGDFINKTASLLNSHQPGLPMLDERFERTLTNFSIQLAAFPFQMKLLGLFQFNRSLAFATLGSTISNAIVLMQYDYKYGEK